MTDLRFKNGTNILSLTGGLRPSYPDAQGLEFYTFLQPNPRYATTEREYASVSDKQYNLVAVKKADRDTLYDFWVDHIDSGAASFTILDPLNRALFNTIWLVFGSPETWRALRQSHSLSIKVQSPCPWTPPIFGAYLFENKDTTEYTGQNADGTLVDGLLIDHATDTKVVRETGAALRTIGADQATQIGASMAINWRSKAQHTTISVFCQMRLDGTGFTGQAFSIVNLSGAGTSMHIKVTGAGSGNLYLKGEIITPTGVADICRADWSSGYLKCPGWYDLMITYDEMDDRYQMMYCPAGQADFYDFLDGEDGLDGNADFDSMHSGILAYKRTVSGTVAPLAAQTWDNLNLSQKRFTSSAELVDTYIQNVMAFDSALTALHFNFLRRLCFQWNNSTEILNPV